MRVFRAAIDVSAVTTAKTLLYLTAPANGVLRILRASITCQDEDTSEQIVAELNRISALGAPTDTAVTPKPVDEKMAASGATAAGNVTADEPTYDASVQSLAHHGANKLAGWEYVPLLEERPIIKGGDTVGLRLIDDIANSSDLTAEIIYEELGG